MIDMLFGSGAADHAAYAAALPLLYPPGTVVELLVGYDEHHLPAHRRRRRRRTGGDRRAGGGDAGFLDQRLFGPVGMRRRSRFDEAGTWVGSSYVYATAREFARFGELYLRDGVAGEGRVLPEGWVDHARTVVAHDPETGFDYGRHWWMWPDQPGSLGAHGYEASTSLVVPEHDVVVVHLGKTDATVRDRLVARLRRLVAAL